MSDFQVVLFVGKPSQENPESLLEGFQQDNMLTTLISERLGTDWSDIAPLLESTLPDLICLFADDLEQQGDNVLDFCSHLRERMDKYRPVLIVQSASPENRRIQYLIQGADDILGPDLSPEEFKIRLLVHLRRNLDFGANEITKLPGMHLTNKVVQRRLNREESVALLTIELDQLDVYSEAYGELPTRQVLKTFSALLSRLVIMPDFISHTDENHFVVVTHPDKADKIAALLCRQFEAANPNFYSEKDRKQGYMVSVIADNISRRVPLMSLSIGIASTQTQPFHTFLSLFNASHQMRGLARMKPGCSWQSDRLRLSGEQTVRSANKPGILVLETDAALAYLLKMTLEMEGYDVDVVSGIEDARATLRERTAEHRTQLVILDALIHEGEDGLRFTEEIRQHHETLHIICTSSLHNRQRVLQSGADLYLPKPFELSNLFSWIHRLLPDTL